MNNGHYPVNRRSSHFLFWITQLKRKNSSFIWVSVEEDCMTSFREIHFGMDVRSKAIIRSSEGPKFFHILLVEENRRHRFRDLAAYEKKKLFPRLSRSTSYGLCNSERLSHDFRVYSTSPRCRVWFHDWIMRTALQFRNNVPRKTHQQFNARWEDWEKLVLQPSLAYPPCQSVLAPYASSAVNMQ